MNMLRMKTMMRAVIVAVVGMMAAEAAGQDRDRGDYGEYGYRSRAFFFEDLDRVIEGLGTPSFRGEPETEGEARSYRLSRSLRGKRHILVLITKGTEERLPQGFNHAEPIRLSHSTWAFTKVKFDRDDPRMKAWGIGRAPGLVALDRYGNIFLRAMALSSNSIKFLTVRHPLAVAQYEAKLKAEFDRAIGYLEADEAKSLGGLLSIVENGKTGYKLVSESKMLLEEHSKAAFQKAELAESVSQDDAIEYLQGLIKIYRKTPWSSRAEIRIALVEHHSGAIQPAILRLQKIGKYPKQRLGDESETLKQALDELSRAGTEKIDEALALEDRAEAKETLKQIARDYAGTDAGRRAALAAASR